MMHLASLDPPQTLLQGLAAVFTHAVARSCSTSCRTCAGTPAGVKLRRRAPTHLVPASRRGMFGVLPFLKLAYLTSNHTINLSGSGGPS
jgi:hypothetical protein